jgi:hypothetical protein
MKCVESIFNKVSMIEKKINLNLIFFLFNFKDFSFENYSVLFQKFEIFHFEFISN